MLRIVSVLNALRLTILQNQKEFTHIKLLIVLTVAIWIAIGLTALTGNFWFTDEGVLKELQTNHP